LGFVLELVNRLELPVLVAQCLHLIYTLLMSITMYSTDVQIALFEFFSDVTNIALYGAVLGWFVSVPATSRFRWLFSRWALRSLPSPLTVVVYRLCEATIAYSHLVVV
jgi:hypothetical protein